MNTSYFFVLLCCFGFGDARRAKTARLTKLADVAPEESVQGSNRQARFNLFSIVKFPNDACVASTTKNGTCYTASECETRNGVNDGSCAQGYGVCCTFTAGCGDTYSQNNTFFDSSSPTDGACSAKVCACNNNICQMRLDFNTFAISGPSTNTLSIGLVQEGEINGAGTAACARGQCQTDTFTITSPSTTPPVICGSNSGEHMYVDVSCTDCIDLAFQLGQGGSTRQWSIKVTQISCNDENLAPAGCTQWHYGSETGTIETYNFEGGQHLANQRQQICIRNEEGMCRICYWHESNADFGTGGPTTSMTSMSSGFTAGCCNMGTDGAQINGPDCVIIPGAVKTITANQVASSNNVQGQFCGGILATIGSGMVAATICTDRIPFTIMFASDNWEWDADMECMTPDTGFRLQYEQSTC